MKMEITFREVVVSIGIALIALTLGFVLATNIHDYITTRNDVYFKALKVQDDPEIFSHAINTEVGNVLSQGEFVADKPVNDSLIKGDYAFIERVEEHYVMKTRTETYKCGKSTCTRTVNYWEWDEHETKVFNTPTFSYLGQTIKTKSLKELPDKAVHKDTVKTESRVRFKFYTIPTQFKGTLFNSTKGKALSGHELYYGETVKSVVKMREDEADDYTLGFWILWILVSVLGIFGFYYLENEWLNEWGK